MTIEPGKVNVLPRGTEQSIILRAEHSGTMRSPTVIRAAEPLATVITHTPPAEYSLYTPMSAPARFIVLEDLLILGEIRCFGATAWAIRRCHVRYAGRGGISAQRSRSVVIEDCVIEQVGPWPEPDAQQSGLGLDNAVYISGDDPVVRRCAIIGAPGVGIQLYEGKSFVRRAEITDNAILRCRYGLYYHPTADGPPPDGERWGGSIIRGNVIQGADWAFHGNRFRNDRILANVFLGRVHEHCMDRDAIVRRNTVIDRIWDGQ